MCYAFIIFCLTINQAGKGGELTHDETTIIAGALELSEKTASDAMSPISDTFAIDINAKLDRCGICLNILKQKVYIAFVSVCLHFFQTSVVVSDLTYLSSCRDLMNLILEKGHSRVPVYYEQPTNIIGLILVNLFVTLTWKF